MGVCAFYAGGYASIVLVCVCVYIHLGIYARISFVAPLRM